MRRITLCIVCLLMVSCLQALCQTKAETIKEIRKLYAEAKEKVEKNGKNGQSPKDMRIVLNRLEDEDIPLYDMEQLDFFFDETTKDRIAVKQPYFIVENWSNHGHTRYHEILIDPKTHRVRFCYMRGETDAGFVVESRYYYDNQGRCIEEKANNTWTSQEAEKENAANFMKIFEMATYNGYFTPLDTDTPAKTVSPKAERMKHIRTLYAKAKAKIAANDKKEMSDDLHIILHDLGDDQPPRTTETRMYFDGDGIYFINQQSSSMQMEGYSELLFEPKSKDLIFSYSRGAEEGQVYEWRYYFDENGTCIETKTKNTDETDEGFYDKRSAKDYQALYQEITEKLQK